MSVRREKRPDFAGQNWVLGKNVVKKIRRRAFFPAYTYTQQTVCNAKQQQTQWNVAMWHDSIPTER